MTSGRVLATVGRYLGGTVLLAVLVSAGVFLRVLVTANLDQRAHADTIVVLGAAQYAGDPSTVFKNRLDHALTLYRSGVAAHIVTVGGRQTGDTYTEAASGKNYLVEHGVAATAVAAVGAGDDTITSLRSAAPVLAANGWHSVVLVTDPWHAYRASRMATDLGWAVEVSSVDTGPAAASGIAPRYLLRETLGTLYFLVIGGSSGAGSTIL
jgi:uncharacterized SAM-binding protein YcdF (DUF218 family)